MENLLANVVSLSFGLTQVLPIVQTIVTGDYWYLALIPGVLGLNIAIESVKPWFGTKGIFARPIGASGCNAFCGGGPVGGKPGFPSGHVAAVSFFVSALWGHTQNPLILWLGIPWILAMAWARWSKQCHNWQQILGGAVVGGVAGSLVGSI
jgi:membrane-associated phospholipid phosphatase